MAEKEADQAPPDPQLLAAQLLKAQAEARKLSAEARRAEVDSLLPTIPTELPAEALTVPEKGSPIGTLAAYRAINNVAASIAQAVPGEVTQVWLVPDERVSRYRAIGEIVMSRLGRFEEALDEVERLLGKPEEEKRDQTDALPLAMGAAAALSLVASGLPALMSFFKIDTTVRGRDITLTFLPVAASVATKLRSGDGSQRRVMIAGVSTPGPGELTERLGGLEKQRDMLARELIGYRAKHSDEPGPDLTAVTDRLAALKAVLDVEAKKTSPNLDPILERIEKASRDVATERQRRAGHLGVANVAAQTVDATDAFLTQARTADTSGMTPLAIAEAAALLKDAHILYLDPTFAGGESVYEQVQMKKDRGLHLGALVVSNVLTDSVGAVVASGVEMDHLAASTEMGSPRITWQ